MTLEEAITKLKEEPKNGYFGIVHANPDDPACRYLKSIGMVDVVEEYTKALSLQRHPDPKTNQSDR
jgi:hypothetical protein